MVEASAEGGGRLHDCRIEPREYARHELRRGRRHVFELVEPVRTALVVIDLVPFFVTENDYCLGIVPTSTGSPGRRIAASGGRHRRLGAARCE